VNRRGFLRALGLASAGAAAGLVLDPDKLLWVPGAKTFFLPPVTLHRGNSLLTMEMVTKDALKVLERNLGISMRLVKDWDIEADKFPTRFDARVIVPQRTFLGRVNG
jgi:hypothetical protein